MAKQDDDDDKKKNETKEDDDTTTGTVTTITREDSIIFQAPMLGKVGFGIDSNRRRQTLAMFTCSLYFILPMTLTCWGIVFIMLSFYSNNPYVAAATACYLGYAFLIDSTPTTGRRFPWLREYCSSWWWNHACDYLPILLVKTANLDPTKRYVMGYHPHGIISVGAFCAFATDGARTLSLVKKEGSTVTKDSTPVDQKNDNNKNRGFSALFPGIDRRVITLPQNFTTPLLREYFLSMGACNSAKETFRSVLQRNGTALVVVVGGAAESLLVQEHSIDLVLEKRRGFVREAIRGNACLVPVIGFGESDLYHVYHPDESDDRTHWVASFQAFVKRMTGIAVPLFQGRSVFLKDVGIMPRRTPVCVVVGAPIEPPPASYWGNRLPTSFSPIIDRKDDTPTNRDAEILIEWHGKYVKALKELHAEYEGAKWNRPGMKERSSLNIVS